MSKFVFTGGHHNSALVVAQKLKSLGHQIYWYGHRYSSRTDHNDSAEYLEVTASHISFYDLPAGRASLSYQEILQIPVGIITAYRLLGKHRPRAVIAFGGYLSAATSFAAYLRRIPILLHEQTSQAGLANRATAYLASRVYLTYKDSQKFFPSNKSQVIGLPLRDSLKSAKPTQFFTRNRPTLLVMGGKQGAHIINQFIFKHLTDILTHFNIIHQTGTSSHTNDYEHALALQNSLGSLADSYTPVGYITEQEIGKYLKSADLYLGRSGAHICYELMYLGVKSILVPLKHASYNEQTHNAKLLVANAQAVILSEDNLTFKNFLANINLKIKPLKKGSQAVPDNALEVMIHDILSL